MLTHISLKAGSSPGKPGLKIAISPVTIFVGPNNSGKSRALVEIEAMVTQPSLQATQVVDELQFEPWDRDEFERQVAAIESEPKSTDVVGVGHILLVRLRPRDNTSVRVQVRKEQLIQEATNPNAKHRNSYAAYLQLYTLRLDGRNRLSLVDDQEAGDLLTASKNHLATLFINNEARKDLRRIVFEAIGKYLVIDPTNIGHLRLRLSDRTPVDDREEQGWDQRSQEFHRAASLVSEASDGVKAFVGTLTTLIAGDPKITLIDEPEAFLHPTLSARLGKEVTKALVNTKRRLFVATHSASFLMGCVQSRAPINIVRLTYDGDIATARLLAQERLVPLMRNPLLRSIGVLSALFHNAVVVTEADADRAFYQEINERLIQSGDPRRIEGCLFLNAQNKQTVWDIVHPLRELGIPAVGIIDIDVLKEGGAVWAKPMNGAFIPEISHNALQIERAALLRAFSETGKDMKRDGGIALLSGAEREACQNMFDQLSEYGVFVVPCGEIEAWLQSLNVSRNKGTWLNTIFEVMGEDATLETYVRPSTGDVWDFVGKISTWVSSSKRKGIPD